MDFLKILQNKNFTPVKQDIVRARMPENKAQPAKQDAKPKVTPPKKPATDDAASTYKVKSSTGKEFTRRRKQASSEFYSMDSPSLLKAYDEAVTAGDDKKRKRVLYYFKKKGENVRQVRRKLNGSE